MSRGLSSVGRAAHCIGRWLGLAAEAVVDPDVDAAAPVLGEPEEDFASCWRCGATMAREGVGEAGCAFCVKQKLPWDRLHRLGAYEGGLRDRVLAMKLGGRWRDAVAMGRELAGVVGEPLPNLRPLVVPVPMHWTRRCWRGYNQAQLIADGLAQAKGWPQAPVLWRRRYTTPLTAVSAGARAGVVGDSFAARAVDLAGRHVFLVDDIKTTGATAIPCVKLLRAAGAPCVALVVAAVADPKQAHFARL